MKCPNCKKRMTKIAKEYQHYEGDILININKAVYCCLWCGEMKYEA